MARYAFIIGFNGPEELGSLKYAQKDAGVIAQVLSSPRCGFETVLAKDVDDASELRQQLFNSASACQKRDTFLCYFSGHGVLERGQLFLVLDRTNPDRIWSTSLSANDVLMALKNCEAANKLLILDCCHAGGAVGFKAGITVPVDELNIEAENHFVLMASNRLERARELDELQGSFLTNKISQALTDKFYEADRDKDRKISIEDLLSWLEICSVKHNSSSLYKVPQPYLFGQKKGDFYLTSDAEAWKPFEIHSPDGSTIAILPIAPYSALINDKMIEVAVGISKHPITNSQYKRFLNETNFGVEKEISNPLTEPIGENFNRVNNKWEGPFYPWGDSQFNSPDKPVVCVSYFDAIEYCKWVQGLFRNPDFVKDQSIKSTISKLYPFDENNIVVDIPPHRLWDFAAFGNEYAERSPRVWLSQTKEIHHKQTSPLSIDTIGSRTNIRGVSDMIGNVWEWCGEDGWSFHDPFSVIREKQKPYDYPDILGLVDIFSELGLRNEWAAKLRGGSFLDDLKTSEPFVRATELRERGKTKHSDLGFRIAFQIPLDYLPDNIQLQLRMFQDVDLDNDKFTVPATA